MRGSSGGCRGGGAGGGGPWRLRSCFGPAPPSPGPAASVLHLGSSTPPGNRTLTPLQGPSPGIPEAAGMGTVCLAAFPALNWTGPAHPTGDSQPVPTPPLTASRWSAGDPRVPGRTWPFCSSRLLAGVGGPGGEGGEPSATALRGCAVRGFLCFFQVGGETDKNKHRMTRLETHSSGKICSQL